MSKKRVLLGLSIIAGGACASLPFRRELPLPSPAAAGSLAALPSESVSPLLAQPVAAAATPLAAVSASAHSRVPPSPYVDDGSRSPAATTSEELTALPKEKSIAPPLLPVSFQVKELTASHPEPWQPARLAEGPAGPSREYRIRKLDTLEDLAERFLGSKDRANELFAANRDVLKDRQILPIGAVIHVPSSGTDSPASSPGSDLRPVLPVSNR